MRHPGNILGATLWLAVLATAGSAAFAAERGWRGDGSGRYPDAEPPLNWDIDEGQNILWQVKVGQGQASPVVTGDLILLTAEPDRLVAIDRETGRLRWSREHAYDTLPPGTAVPAKRPATAAGCGYSTPTPVTDGRFVYASFGTGVVVCYDLAGNRRWIRLLDLPLLTEYGRSVSPVLADGKLVVTMGGLLALDPTTGETLWHATQAPPAYGTPAVTRIGQVSVALTPHGDCVRLADGRVVASRLTKAAYTSPLVHAGVVFVAAPPVAAYRVPDQPADTVAFERLWENDEVEGEFFASPVWHDGILYCASNEGTLYALDAATGKLVFQQELPIRGAAGRGGQEPANVYPSLTLAGRHLLVGNDAGEMLVLAPGREYRQEARNLLDRGSGATPVPDGRRVLVRGGDALYCLGPRQ